jgi:hypothetical protein
VVKAHEATIAQEGNIMAPRMTVNDLALIVAEDRKNLPNLIAEQVGKALAQFSTPTAVAEVITLPTQASKASKKAAKTAAKPAPAPVVEIPETPAVVATVASVAGDKLKSFVEGKSLAFAKGGRTNLNTDALSAIARVLKTGTPEIVTMTNEALVKRGIVGLAIGLNGTDGVITQYVFDPSKTRS